MYENQTAVLNCPCKEFSPMTDPAPILAAYQKARSRAEQGSASRWPGVFQSLFKKPQESQDGFLPVLIAAGEDSPLEGFEWLKGETPEEYRQKLLSQPVEDGRTLLTRMAAQRKEFAAENDWDWPGEDVLGPMEGGEAIDHFLGISDFHGKTIPLVLAEIPVQHPWEVFAYVPFGGWNECPSSQEHMAAAKYWYEKFGAVPAVITRDVLEYDLPVPVKREEAMALALEQYAFCPDIVDQGCQSVGYLADTLAMSTKWYFWWD